jgi:hypothetical protein
VKLGADRASFQSLPEGDPHRLPDEKGKRRPPADQPSLEL